MTVLDIAALIPGFAGLALSVFLLWRTELRQARMSLRLLAPPDSWTIAMARRGALAQTVEPADADYLSMHGIFPMSATNDGPRGGAVWNLATRVDGLRAWRVASFSSGQELPYALAGRSCEGWSRTAISLACDFERLGDGLRELLVGDEVIFGVTYTCPGWRGRAREKSTSLKVPRQALLAALKRSARFLDLAACQIVPQTRALAAERFGEFNLSSNDVDILTKWTLMREQVDYIVVPEGSSDGLKIAVRRATGQVDQAWTVGYGRQREELGRIIEVQNGLVSDVKQLMAAAVQI